MAGQAESLVAEGEAMTMRAVLLALTLLAGATNCPAEPPAKPKPSPTKLQEDDPGWDCETMGDKKCGPDWHKQ